MGNEQAGSASASVRVREARNSTSPRTAAISKQRMNRPMNRMRQLLAMVLATTPFVALATACDDHYTTQEAYAACEQLGQTNPGVLEQTLSAYGGGPAARAGLGIQLHPDVELRLEGVGRGSVVPASYEPSEDGESLPVGWGAREDRWLMIGGRAGLGVIL